MSYVSSLPIIRIELDPKVTQHKTLPIGTKFSKLQINSTPFKIKGRNRRTIYYDCVCDCGEQKIVAVSKLIRKRNPAVSCGCTPPPRCLCSECGGINTRSGKICEKCDYIRQKNIHRQLFDRQRNTISGFVKWRLSQTKAKNRAKARDGKKHQEVSITFNQAFNLWKRSDGKCALTGLPMTTKKDSLYSGSMDRIDSDRGYTGDNVQWVCYSMNIAKGHWTNEEFLDFLSELRNHNPNP
jgi:hypothetical protein